MQLALPAAVPRLHMSPRVFQWSGLSGGVCVHQSLFSGSQTQSSVCVCEERAAEAREHNKHRERLRGTAHNISSIKIKEYPENALFVSVQHSSLKDSLTHVCVDAAGRASGA